jgi:S1-C subfamily serine protease
VIERAAAVRIKLPAGGEFAATGIVALKPDLDLAVLRVEAQGVPVVALGDSDAVQVGERVVAIGSPMGLQNTVSDGLVSAIREKAGQKVFQITAPVSPGSSGGPLFNAKGQVIGITFASVTEGQNLNFAIPINDAKPLIGDATATTLESGTLSPRPAGRDDCPVVGNRVSGIYHLPGGQFYHQMQFSRNGVCFQSEADATRAGFRRSLR